MSPQAEKSSLKRARGSAPEDNDSKKPRRSARLSQADEEPPKPSHLPSPVTRGDELSKAGTITPPHERVVRATPVASPPPKSNLRSGLSSPPSDTQPFSQFLAPPPISYEVENEEAEGVWGYLVPISGFSEPLVLRKRAACPVPPAETGKPTGRQKVSKKHWEKKEETYEFKKVVMGSPGSGYLVGRHPECDQVIDVPTVSNRHCLFFPENKNGDAIAVLEDLSGNGTYVNDGMVGRNKRRELHDGDEISILDQARFIFRYPRNRDTNGFRQQYNIQGQLGKGHFATVYLATEKNTGLRFAVKKFEKRSGPGERSKMDGLQQEIAVLMGVSHPNMLCLKDTFDEADGVYLVLELAAEGELFNWIVMKQKLSEDETRKVFIQLFQGVKYLHERNIVHRDIKPENILLLDKDLSVKLADFGLAKIIGEESFTTTLCGTPSYVAPEILEQSNHRRYTRAVDVWSLGVVLYICLCGFPPFSDELYSAENPYTLSQQIKMARFDFPSPYWDSVGDAALDLIDHMLTVDVDQRYTIDECLEHPWTTQKTLNPNDSTDGLTGKLAGLDFSRRKPVRERTMLSAINDVKVSQLESQPNGDDVKVFHKNEAKSNGDLDPKVRGTVESTATAVAQPKPADGRLPQEFIEMGGKGDEVLLEGGSRYPDETMAASPPPK
nr:putative serine/threonine-protein kinase fhkc [Quercus suber]